VEGEQPKLDIAMFSKSKKASESFAWPLIPEPRIRDLFFPFFFAIILLLPLAACKTAEKTRNQYLRAYSSVVTVPEPDKENHQV